MKDLLRSLVVSASILGSASALAADPQRLGDCADYADRYQATAETRERFGMLKGSCEGVYDIDGALYARAEMVVRSVHGNRVRLYLPATDQTIEVRPDMNHSVYINGLKRRVRNLSGGDEIQLYLALDKFFEERVTEVAFAADDTSEDLAHVTPAAEVAALPTTASQLPAIALASGAMLAGGLLLGMRRRSRVV
ncbi:hypothetical protein E4634_11505 [Mangrovimicrobium sediminis]|uniref:LPXTG cell wall anchor domain-containing protein n=1 Tax=Mangrovimicrobium sediminis TaxID=2562682 RepID=A0A4Z0M2X4_9GAMM|nr:hypothetical protein [Haliea sp. SAOS-164]TGD73635.1 hypothetical protein E4634_11505 [Haliea sp. SAOS-164]